MKPPVVLLIVAACAAAAFFAGRATVQAPEPLPSGADSAQAQALPPEAASLDADRLLLERAQARVAALESSNRTLTAEAERLEEAAARTAAPATPEAADPAARAPSDPRYAFATFAEVLSEIAWDEAGEAAAKILPLLATMKTTVEAGEDVDSSTLAGVGRWNQRLVDLALKVAEAQVPGTGINGTFTHPAVTVNLIHATLAEAGLPLDASQEGRLAEIGNRYLEEDARRLAGYGEETIALGKTIEEAALKDRLYAEVDALLTPEQRDVLHPPAVRGRLGVDIFSSGVMWYTIARPAAFSTDDDLASAFADRVKSDVPGFTDADGPLLDDVAARWAAAFGPADLAHARDEVARASMRLSAGLLPGWIRIELARRAAEATLDAWRTLLDRLPPTSAARKRLREGHLVPVPIQK